MRLSDTQKLLLHFLLIISLTLLFKLNANAQVVSPNTVFAYNDYLHNRPLLNEPETDHIYIRADINKHDEETTDEQVLPTINFHRMLESLSKPLAYHMIKNNGKAYQAHNITRIRLYSIDLKHSARLTFKLFKLVIVPLRRSK